MKTSADLLRQHNLTEEEYNKIVEILGREPNFTELGIFSVMWSEHCSYKSSKVHLKRLPTKGACVVQGPGENAGVVDIGDGLVIVFKMESHNHPSFIEPYQGAATGVGGIIRDIFTMGARPIAIMDSLHFGPLGVAKNRAIMEGVIAGIAGYGNSVGIPTLGGETIFADCYSANPIVNVFCLGLAKKDQLFYAHARGAGNPVIYVGARTGRDGIHGATMASAEFNESSQEKRPNVQIGDPFLEKLLIEACLEAMRSGSIVGIQDMGAAGLTSSSCEMGARGGTGIEIHLEKIPQRETGMTPYEIMLSESQERMLIVGEKGKEKNILDIFQKWGLEAVVVGHVTEETLLTIKNQGSVEAAIPNRALVNEAPVYDRPQKKPSYIKLLESIRDEEAPLPIDYNQTVMTLLASHNLVSKHWVYEQYDHMVRTDTLLLPGSDAAVLRIKGSDKALAMCLEGNPRYCYLDPRRGAMIAVAESCRNLVVTGAKPLAATNCLNFGNPENPEIMWQFSEAIDGLAEACNFFGTPITGGNVSFYNETMGKGIFPTPVIGMVGLLENKALLMTGSFKNEGDLIILLGEHCQELGGSEYLSFIQGFKLSEPPRINLGMELAVQETCSEAIRSGIIKSAHDCSDGGLAIALIESCVDNPRGMFGCKIRITSATRPDALLFGESQSRILVSLSEKDLPRLEALARLHKVPFEILGRTALSGIEIIVNEEVKVSLPLESVRMVWGTALESTMRQVH